MAEEIGFENGRNSNFEGLVTLTLTLDPAIRHTVVHHSSTSTYKPNFIEIGGKFFSKVTPADVRMDGHFSPLILLGRLLEVDLKSNMTTKSNELLTSASRFATPGDRCDFSRGRTKPLGPCLSTFLAEFFHNIRSLDYTY